MAFNLTNYGAAELLDFTLDIEEAVVRPTAVYLALHSADPTAAGNLNEIGAGVGYSRQLLTFSSSGSSVARNTGNTNIITFGPAISGGFTVAYMTIWDSATVGNPWWYAPITNQVVVTGDSYTVLAGQITVTFPAS